MSLLLQFQTNNVTADLTVTEGADVAAFQASIILSGSLTVTEGADNAAFGGSVILLGSLGVTDGADVFAATASEVFTATMAAVEGADLAAFVGEVVSSNITGDLAAGEGADVVSIVGSIPAEVVNIGGRIIGSIFTRKQWKRLVEEIAKAREDEHKSVRRAARQATIVADLLRGKEQAVEGVERLCTLLASASAAQTTAEAVAESWKVVALARKITLALAQAARDEEDEEEIVLLMAA